MFAFIISTENKNVFFYQIMATNIRYSRNIAASSFESENINGRFDDNCCLHHSYRLYYWVNLLAKYIKLFGHTKKSVLVQLYIICLRSLLVQKNFQKYILRLIVIKVIYFFFCQFCNSCFYCDMIFTDIMHLLKWNTVNCSCYNHYKCQF